MENRHENKLLHGIIRSRIEKCTRDKGSTFHSKCDLLTTAGLFGPVHNEKV